MQTSGNSWIGIGPTAGASTGDVLQLGYFATGDYGIIQAENRGTGYEILALNPSGGNVGIGTTTPTHKLSVNGNMTVNATIEPMVNQNLTIDASAGGGSVIIKLG